MTHVESDRSFSWTSRWVEFWSSSSSAAKDGPHVNARDRGQSEDEAEGGFGTPLADHLLQRKKLSRHRTRQLCRAHDPPPARLSTGDTAVCVLRVLVVAQAQGGPLRASRPFSFSFRHLSNSELWSRFRKPDSMINFKVDLRTHTTVLMIPVIFRVHGPPTEPGAHVKNICPGVCP